LYGVFFLHGKSQAITIIGFAMQNVLEVKNITLLHSILGRLPSEMAQMKPVWIRSRIASKK
jgi:hypothetical protein